MAIMGVTWHLPEVLLCLLPGAWLSLTYFVLWLEYRSVMKFFKSLRESLEEDRGKK